MIVHCYSGLTAVHVHFMLSTANSSALLVSMFFMVGVLEHQQSLLKVCMSGFPLSPIPHLDVLNGSYSNIHFTDNFTFLQCILGTKYIVFNFTVAWTKQLQLQGAHPGFGLCLDPPFPEMTVRR